jgi:hypothetical protein
MGGVKAQAKATKDSAERRALRSLQPLCELISCAATCRALPLFASAGCILAQQNPAKELGSGTKGR